MQSVGKTLLACVLGVWLWSSPSSAQAQQYNIDRHFYYPYYYFPHSYWPTQGPRWPEPFRLMQSSFRERGRADRDGVRAGRHGPAGTRMPCADRTRSW